MPSTLISAFPNYKTADSIFQKMNALGAPWPETVSPLMDDAYFSFYSGIKTPSMFVDLHTSNGAVSSSEIASILWAMFGRSWARLWEAYIAQYTPIDNYNVKEVMNRTQTDDRTIDKKGTLSSNTSDETDDSGTSSMEHGENISSSATVKNFNYGFNSEEMVPTTVQQESGTEEHSGTDTETTTDKSTTTGTRDDTTSENTTDNDNVSEDINRTRQGNIGQNTYQELLRQEFELWKWNFFKQVFDDVDTYLALAYYSGTCNNH